MSVLLYSTDGLVCSGSPSIEVDVRGQGPVRLFATATSGTLTSMSVSEGPDSTHQVAQSGASVFSGLGANASAQLWIDKPVSLLTLVPLGVAVDLRITKALDPD